ncbi:MAG: hypothetical protein U0269_36310 [Polyangiales bacterium]
MQVATLMMLVAPLWWSQHQPRMQPVADAIERASPDVHTRALLATIDYHETSWHTARGRFAPFGVMRSLRQTMTEDEVVALALRFLAMGRQRCGSTLGMLGWYHFGRCRVTRWERREVETLHRFERMLRSPEPSVPPIIPSSAGSAQSTNSTNSTNSSNPTNASNSNPSPVSSTDAGPLVVSADASAR